MQAEQKKNDAPKPKGRPPLTAGPKKSEISIEVDGEYLVIRVPKKEVSRKLLAELI